MTKRAVCGLLFDETGSMGAIAQEAVKSVGEYIETLKDKTPAATVIISTFNSCKGLSVLRRGIAKDISVVSHEEYRPSCSTPLIDSMMAMIKMLKEETSKGDNVVLVVMTDGEENCSRDYSLEELKKKVKSVRDKRNWEVIFLGANMDTFGFGAVANIKKSDTISWTGTGKSLLETMSDASVRTVNYLVSEDNSSDFVDTYRADSVVISTTDDDQSVA